MAIIRNNPITQGMSGMLGNTIVFKTLRGKTVISNRPAPPKKQSVQQKANRSKFREASAYAKMSMLDPVKKEYYWRKAKHLKLPNAYTAAIADYMRKAVMKVINEKLNGDVIAAVSKKDFRLSKIDVYKKDAVTHAPMLVRAIAPTKYCEWIVCLTADEISAGAYLRIEDEPGNTFLINCGK